MKGLLVFVGFQFEAIWKDNDVTKVRVSGWNGVFGGTTNVYVGRGKLEEIAAEVRGFPSHTSDSREITLGAFGPKFAGGGVSMRFRCVDGVGHAAVDSKIESDYDANDEAQSVVFTLHVEAAAVDSFAGELYQLGANRAGIAHLRGILVE